MTDKKWFIYPLWILYLISFFAYFFCPENKFKIISFIGFIIAIIGLIITLKHFNNKRKEENENSESEDNERIRANRSLHDWKLVFFVFDSVFMLILVLAHFKLLIPPDDMYGADYGKIEWFLAVVSVIGIVGAIWAILAKMDANRAFIQAQKAHNKATIAASTAMDAFRAVAGIVSFEDMFVLDGKRQGVPMLEGFLDDAHEELVMVLGIPAIGYFRKKEITNKKGKVISVSYPLREKNKAINFCNHLANFIYDIPNKDLKLFRLFYFNDATLAKYTKGALDEKEITEKDKVDLENAYRHLNDMIESVKQRIPNTKVFQCERYSAELGIRFVIAHSQLADKMTEDKALVWVVSDFAHDDPGKFDAAGFTTRDKYIIDNLKTLSEGYVKTLPNLIDKNENQVTKP